MPIEVLITKRFRSTALLNFHKSNGARMIKFAGWDMPLVYSNLDVKESAIHTRKAASLFDVSHMLQTAIIGRDSVAFVASLVTGNLTAMHQGTSKLTVFTNSCGGVIDDAVVSIEEGGVSIVANASRASVDLGHLDTEVKTAKTKGLDVKCLGDLDRSLLAIQGPEAVDHMVRVFGDPSIAKLPFMSFQYAYLNGSKFRIARSGYTGEDGFEISMAHGDAERLAMALLVSPTVKLAGLGARDVLRLEAGLRLYGRELSEDVTPVEAGLAWTVDRSKAEGNEFPGARKILEQLKQTKRRRLVGLLFGSRPIREGVGVKVVGGCDGLVTSGTLSPTLGKAIAFAFLGECKSPKVGTKVEATVHGRVYDGQIVRLPFVARPLV